MIRPLKKFDAGVYILADGRYEFVRTNNEWKVYERLNNVSIGIPFYFKAHSTLKSLIKALENVPTTESKSSN